MLAHQVMEKGKRAINGVSDLVVDKCDRFYWRRYEPLSEEK